MLSLTVKNVVPNVAECKKIEIHTHSSSSKGRIIIFSWARFFVNKNMKIGRKEDYSVLPSISHEQTRTNQIE